MSEFHRLRAYLDSKATFTEEEFAFLEPPFLPRALRAGEFLQRAGDAATHGAFVATGCLRKYIIDAKGKEHIVQFAPENWWVGEGLIGCPNGGNPSAILSTAVRAVSSFAPT